MLKKPTSVIIGIALGFAAFGAHANGSGSSYAQCIRTQPVQFNGTIVEAALATPALSTLASLVVAAETLVDDLSAPGNLTVFAPTNDAFAAIPSAVLGAIGGEVGSRTVLGSSRNVACWNTAMFIMRRICVAAVAEKS